MARTRRPVEEFGPRRFSPPAFPYPRNGPPSLENPGEYPDPAPARGRRGEALSTTKYIFVTGGVVSSPGKGLASASIGCLLEGHGFKVAMMKCDPYLNVDPGTMSPYQHGEVYVTDDGAEADLDLGHYERFTHCVTSRGSNITTGKIYGSVIAKERH